GVRRHAQAVPARRAATRDIRPAALRRTGRRDRGRRVTAAPRLVVIVGPTGAGKTRLALALAERTGGEVISCDSQQVYVGMDIGTGKVSAAERARVPHHGIDIIEPDQDMTAQRFVEVADRAIADLAARGKPAIVCGGTGLYVRALLLGLFEGPPASPEL